MLSAAATVNFWVTKNAATFQGMRKIPDTDPSDLGIFSAPYTFIWAAAAIQAIKHHPIAATPARLQMHSSLCRRSPVSIP
jgi:hypothetical protein